MPVYSWFNMINFIYVVKLEINNHDYRIYYRYAKVMTVTEFSIAIHFNKYIGRERGEGTCTQNPMLNPQLCTG